MSGLELRVDNRRVERAAVQQPPPSPKRLPWAINNALRGFGLPHGYAAMGYLQLTPRSMRP